MTTDQEIADLTRVLARRGFAIALFAQSNRIETVQVDANEMPANLAAERMRQLVIGAEAICK